MRMHDPKRIDRSTFFFLTHSCMVVVVSNIGKIYISNIYFDGPLFTLFCFARMCLNLTLHSDDNVFITSAVPAFQ